ncbi:MAG: protein kinase [Gemmatimonadota bacterium]
MSETRTCHRCGTEVEGNALFCSRCGQDMTLLGDEQETLTVTTAGTPIEPVRSTMRQALRDATLGEYEILSELGRGGMATVFLAHDISLDRKVAIKVMAPHLLEGEGMAERFKLEARTAAQLSHPHIIPIYAVKETAETLFFVMKFVEGRGLDSVIKKSGQLPIPMVTDILTKVGSALGYAHRRDVVHRDIKPGNIMIDDEGTPIVTDFGIAKVAEAKGLTVTGTTIGTPSYMSPEQCEAREVTGASDQYSLGIVAFEMLTGKLPFEGDSAVTTMYKHCHEPLPPLEDFRPDCPPELRETIERMVAKKPEDRWPSLEAAVRRLNNDATPTQVDPIRSHLMELVKEGDADELLARLSDPSGPVTRRTDPQAGQKATSSAGPRRGVVAGVVAVAVLSIGAALVVLQPWAGGSSQAGVDPGIQQGSAAVPPAPSQPAGGGDGSDGSAAPTGGGSPAEAAVGVGSTEGSPTGGSSDAGSDGDDGAGTSEPDPVPANPPAGGGPGSAGTPSGGATPPPARPTVASVQIGGAPGELQPGGTAQLTSRALDATGNTVPDQTAVWTSSNERVATVDGSGGIRAVSPGETMITASAGGRSGSIRLTVAEAPVASVGLSRTSLEMTVGDEESLFAEPRDASGTALSRTVAWRSSDPSVATVDDGRVTAAGPGTATITVSSENASETADVTVLVDTRTAVEDVVEAYGRALESLDVAQVRAVYPGVTSDRASALQEMFRYARDMRVDYTVGDVVQEGTTATADVTGTWLFTDSRAGMQELAQNFTATFERRGSTWRLANIVDR